MTQINIGANDVEIVGDRFLLVPKARLNYFPHIGCIFIHIPKTAGTSVSAALAQIDEYLRLDGAPPKFALPARPHYKHAKAVHYLEKMEKDIWDNAFKFCVVRNPFEQMVSSYHWWTQLAPRFRDHQKNAELVISLGSFEAYVNHDLGSTCINECKGESEHWFLGHNNEDLTDFVVQSENLNAMFEQLKRFVPSMPRGVKIEQKNATQRRHYSSYYTDDVAHKVGQRFSYIMDRFGYRFTTG